MENDPQSNAERSLTICNLFESEVLVWLLLRNWSHPFTEDSDYRNELLEATTEILSAAATQGNHESYIDGLPNCDMNFIAALWYGEFMAIQNAEADRSKDVDEQRRWLTEMRQTFPSCFCAVDDLGPN